MDNDALRQLYDERFARDKERIDKLETLTTKVSECSIKLSDMVEVHNAKIIDHDKRLQKIEDRPRDWVEKVISGIIAAIVAFVINVMLK